MAIKNTSDFYSVLSQLSNNLEDDLQLDLEKGENGYGSYEESYNAVRKYTLRVLRAHLKKLKKQLSETTSKHVKWK